MCQPWEGGSEGVLMLWGFPREAWGRGEKYLTWWWIGGGLDEQLKLKIRAYR